MRAVLIVTGLLGACCTLISSPARAQEWSIDGGAGARWLRTRGIGPMVEVGVSRELGDPFELKLGVALSHHERAGKTSDVLGAAIGLAVEFDVIRWVPSGFVEVGGYDFMGDAVASKIHGPEVGIATGMGLDYLLSRQIAVGVVARGHLLLSADPVALPAIDTLFRFRYRLGW